MTSVVESSVLESSVAAFDVCGPLPEGTTVLEASAGTGKTYTIASLAVRYVAEGHATLPELMLVTFGREATQELRERVRSRLVDVAGRLHDPATARMSGDAVVGLLASVPDIEVARRRTRLTTALAQFDAATIATTHQFCQQMLAGLGVAGDRDIDATFVESLDELVGEVVDDFYVRKYGDRAAGTPAFSRKEALALARAAVGDGQARLEPAHAERGSTAQIRYSFADAVRKEVERRKRARQLYTYDDMLTRLRDALADPAHTAPERLRARFRVVLVDEFQDTDPVQWEILRRAFHGHVALVLIGDPKQAIYAFRGADVLSYLDATKAADTHATLATNWRSDAPLLAALEQVFGGASLGDERITVHPVSAHYAQQRLPGVPFRLRVLDRTGLPLARSGLVMVAQAREKVARDCAADIADALGEGSLAPGDIAVLVRRNDQGALIRSALATVGVPAVLAGTSSVFGSPVAREWLLLLEAVEQPRARQLRAAALTDFLGHTVEELCGPEGESLLEALGTRVRAWAAILRERGVAALQEAVTTETGLAARLLSRVDGERRLTDLRHIGQALHAAASGGHLGQAALVDWLRHRIGEAVDEVAVERSRRLESDAAAVQIMTIHRSKGLEFPVVYLPFGWDRHVPEPEVPLFHDTAGNRVLDVGGPTGEELREHLAAHRAEEAGEDLRLLYVALTRARSRVVTWWVPATTTAASPIHRLLIGRPAARTVPAQTCKVPPDVTAVAALRALESPVLAVERVLPRAASSYAVGAGGEGALRVAVFGRQLDTRWRRTSYTALTAGVAHVPAGVASEAEHRGVDDEPVPPGSDAEPDAAGAPLGETVDERVVEVPAPERSAAHAVPSPMAALPVGAGFGTLVHGIFEVADLTAPDLHGELGRRAREQLAHHPTPGVEAEALAAALVPVAQTSLGPLADGLRLADIAPRDRLAELDFELPLAGGDRPRARQATLGALGALLRRHLPAADPLRAYPEALEGPELAEQPLRGYLTGSIDAVLRLPGGRFAIVDYKTNWLGPLGADAPPLTAANYLPPVLAQAMIAANYPLQALLYCVALHRYLRWRLAGYEPERHLGGVLYLFLRGMCGPSTPTVDDVPCGVFSWAPPPGLVVELSTLLEGRP